MSVLQAQRAVVPPSHAVQYGAALLHLRVRLGHGVLRAYQLRTLRGERSQDVGSRTLRRVRAALGVLQPRGGVLQAGGATQQLISWQTSGRTRAHGE